MADNWMLGEAAALDDYIPNVPTNILGNAAQGVRDWYTNQPSWLDRARAENQRTAEAYQRGGMGAIAQQLTTDTTEAQDLASGFGGNIKGVRPPVAPGALAATSEYRPPFYSAVEQAVQGAKQNAAPGQQWAGFLRNQPGVKPEEVEALKLGKLFEQPGSVSKEAVLGEIAANRVNVKDVIKSDALDMRQYSGKLEAGAQEHFSTNYDNLSENQQAVVRKLALGDQGYSPTKFSQYTLPGGENYREMLLTLPPKVEHAPVYDLIDRNGRLIQGGVYREDLTARLAENPGATSRPSPGYIQSERGPSDVFRSSHFDEPNVLAHVRYNDRVIDGKKTLFVEEVQSDWHQKGKRHGYAGQPDDPEVSKILERFTNAGDEVSNAAVNRAVREGVITRAEADRVDAAFSSAFNKVPDAPFKTTWPELAMKRIIREAAEKGYDKVAWTPGSVQAARYPEQLRQHVDEIAWSSPGTPRSNPEGLRYVHAKPRAGGMDLVFTVNKDGMITEASASQAKGQHVEDIFGKDMSRQIMDKVEGEIASKDFVIGAKGQQGFYDEILPATVNRLVKKHGGRVQQDQMVTRDASKFDIEFSGGGWRIVDKAANEGRGLFIGGVFRNGADAEKWLADKGHLNQSVHALDITPSLRAAAMKGFPLFSAGGVAATGAIGELARQDEYR